MRRQLIILASRRGLDWTQTKPDEWARRQIMDWSKVMLPSDKPKLYDLQREERIAEYERAGWADFERAAQEHSERLAREARVPFWFGLITLALVAVAVVAALVEMG